jgi:transcriptional regulator of heat shock response
MENKIQFDGINYVIKQNEDNKDVILTSPEEVRKETAQYYKQLFTKKPYNRIADQIKQEMAHKTDIQTQWYDSIMDEIKQEIINAIKQMGNKNKTPGPSDITKEHYEYANNTVIKALSTIFNQIMKGATVPDEMNNSKTILLAKKPEVNGNLDNTRPITQIR